MAGMMDLMSIDIEGIMARLEKMEKESHETWVLTHAIASKLGVFVFDSVEPQEAQDDPGDQ